MWFTGSLLDPSLLLKQHIIAYGNKEQSNIIINLKHDVAAFPPYFL
jgi:hypothetical protein